jgi:acetylornithine deacetylase
MFRTVGDVAALRKSLKSLERWVQVDDVLEVPPVTMPSVPGFETAAFPYTTDIPFLSRWGTPLLLGPGSIHVAHTDEEHVDVAELHRAVDCYVRLARHLLGR